MPFAVVLEAQRGAEAQREAEAQPETRVQRDSGGSSRGSIGARSVLDDDRRGHDVGSLVDDGLNVVHHLVGDGDRHVLVYGILLFDVSCGFVDRDRRRTGDSVVRLVVDRREHLQARILDIHRRLLCVGPWCRVTVCDRVGLSHVRLTVRQHLDIHRRLLFVGPWCRVTVCDRIGRSHVRLTVREHLLIFVSLCRFVEAFLVPRRRRWRDVNRRLVPRRRRWCDVNRRLVPRRRRSVT